MDSVDPFAVVAPKERKMAAYLKASKGAASSNKCVETSSHGTETTRSITCASEDLSIFSKSHDQSSKSTLLNNSSSIVGRSGGFDFGSDADFSAFEDTAFEDDAFDPIGRSDRSAKASKSSRSCRNLKTSSQDDLHNTPSKKVSRSMRNLSTPKPDCFDPFTLDEALASDPFKEIDEGFAAFDEGSDAMFGDDGFGGNAFSPAGQGSSKKRESRSKEAKTNGGAESRKRSSERRLRKPRDDIPAPPQRKGSTPSGVTRKKSSSTTQAAAVPSGKCAKQHDALGKGSGHSNGADVRNRPRSSRRISVTGRLPNPDDTEVEGGQTTHRRPRRSSVGYSHSDNALEPAKKATPARQKSAPGPAHRLSGGRRQRRASLIQSVEELAFMRTTGDAEVRKQADTWEDERALNQEKIIEMTRSGGANRKDGKQDSSIRDMAKIMAMIKIEREDEKPSKEKGRSKSRSKRTNKNDKGEEAENELRGEVCKMRRDRSRGSLVDRIAGHDSFESEPGTGHRDKDAGSSGLSYSDKVMRASQRRLQ